MGRVRGFFGRVREALGRGPWSEDRRALERLLDQVEDASDPGEQRVEQHALVAQLLVTGYVSEDMLAHELGRRGWTIGYPSPGVVPIRLLRRHTEEA